MKAALTVEGLSVRFGGHSALEDVRLSLALGERMAVLGPNGAGKTTLLDAIGGQIFASAGQVLLGGADVTGWPAHRRARAGLARSFQHLGLVGRLDAVDNVALADPEPDPPLLAEALALPAARRAREARAARARAALAEAGLPTAPEGPVEALPAEICRAVAVARVLVARPQVVLLDEPSAGLGPEARRALLTPILALEPAPALLLVEHDPQLVAELTHRALILEGGRVVAELDSASLPGSEALAAVYPEAS